MTLTENKQDLFKNTDTYYYAHCISADFALGAGIAVRFDKRYNMASKLKVLANPSEVGSSVLISNVFNLVTKEKYWQKPTYKSLESSLVQMRDYMIRFNIKKLAMPKIGCGLDRLQWDKVKAIIEELFKDTDIEILVCYL